MKIEWPHDIDCPACLDSGACECWVKEASEYVAKLEEENETLRDQFEQAAERIKTGRTKRLMFKCSHCQKDTPLLIDALLTGDNDV